MIINARFLINYIYVFILYKYLIIILGDTMRQIDLGKYDVRTDLLIDDFINKNILNDTNYKKTEVTKDIVLEELILDSNNSELFKKLPGIYKCISFNDITDKDHYNMVLDTFIDSFKKFLKELNIDDSKSAMIVGLGNRKVTPDAIGPLVLDNIIVTHHLLEFGPLEEGFRDITVVEPGVSGTTGIDTKDHILGLINIVKPDFLIVIDALKTTSTSRIIKTIQFSNTGIIPGSGVNNNRKGITEDELNIPIISIGVPSVIESTTIVFDTIKYLMNKVSYEKDHFNNYRNKLAITNDFKDYDNKLSDDEKEHLLGMIGIMDDNDLKKLLSEVLNPLNYNMIVTPKEIDFLVEKISKLIAEGINYSINSIKRHFQISLYIKLFIGLR